MMELIRISSDDQKQTEHGSEMFSSVDLYYQTHKYVSEDGKYVIELSTNMPYSSFITRVIQDIRNQDFGSKNDTMLKNKIIKNLIQHRNATLEDGTTISIIRSNYNIEQGVFEYISFVIPISKANAIYGEYMDTSMEEEEETEKSTPHITVSRTDKHVEVGYLADMVYDFYNNNMLVDVLENIYFLADRVIKKDYIENLNIPFMRINDICKQISFPTNIGYIFNEYLPSGLEGIELRVVLKRV